jgi:hypothetical protein
MEFVLFVVCRAYYWMLTVNDATYLLIAHSVML